MIGGQRSIKMAPLFLSPHRYGFIQQCTIVLASFPGSHAWEPKHWSCAGVESLVFILTWEAVKDRHEVDATLIVRGRMWLRTEKGTKVAGNLLHVSSYRVSNIIHTERWSVIGWTTRKRCLSVFVLFWLCHAYVRKIPGSPRDTYSHSGRAWEWGYYSMGQNKEWSDGAPVASRTWAACTHFVVGSPLVMESWQTLNLETRPLPATSCSDFYCPISASTSSVI